MGAGGIQKKKKRVFLLLESIPERKGVGYRLTRNITSSRRLTLGLQRHIFSKLERFARMATSSSRPCLARSSFPLSIFFSFFILSADA